MATDLGFSGPGFAFANEKEPTFKVEQMDVTMQGKPVTKALVKGDTVDVLIELSSVLKTEDYKEEEQLEILLKGENFSMKNKPSVKIISKKGEALRLVITLEQLLMKSDKNQLDLQLKGEIGQAFDETVRLEVKRLVKEKDPGKPVPKPPVLHDEPTLNYQVKNIPSTLEASQSISAVLVLTNEGSTALQRPQLSVKPSSGLTMTGVSSKGLSDIPAGKSVEFPLQLKVSDNPSSNEALDVELTFHYDSGQGSRIGSSTYRVDLAIKRPSTDSSHVIISNTKPSTALAADESMDISLAITNKGTKGIEDVSISLQTSDAIYLTGKQSTYVVGDLAAGKAHPLKVNVKAGTTLPSELQALLVDVSYRLDGERLSVYDRIAIPVASSGEDSTGESPSDVSPAPSDSYPEPSYPSSSDSFDSSGIATPAIDSAVPNVLINKFKYGEKPVAAGATFELSIDLINTSAKLAVENIVMAIEPGEGFAIDGASNVYHIPKLKASGNLNQKIKLTALPSAKTGSNAIEISFRYEYVEQDKRNQANMTQKLSVPIFQPDRFEITSPELPQVMSAGEEIAVNLNYVNKGKSEVSNVEAVIDGDIPSVAKVQNLGNFEAGKSGTIAFLMTPEQAGQVKVNLKVNYEDANQELKTKEFPLTLEIQESVAPPMEENPEDMMEMEPEEEKSVFPWILGAVVVAGAVAVVIWRKKRKDHEDDTWDDDSL